MKGHEYLSKAHKNTAWGSHVKMYLPNVDIIIIQISFWEKNL